MKKPIFQLLLITALEVTSLNKMVMANPHLSNCYNSPKKINVIATANMEKFNYHLVEITNTETDFHTNVLKLDSSGNCSVVTDAKQIASYPLSNSLGQEIAHNLLTSKYLTLINELGGKKSFINALIDELDAGVPHIFFEDEVRALKELGIDLKAMDSSLFIVGAEGIEAHPELNF